MVDGPVRDGARGRAPDLSPEQAGSQFAVVAGDDVQAQSPEQRLHGRLPAEQREPLLGAAGGENGVLAFRLGEGSRPVGRVEVPRIHDRVVGKLREAVDQAVVHRGRVAPGKVRPPAALEEERVACHEAAVHEEALASRGVARRVQETDLDLADSDDIVALVGHEAVTPDSRCALDPRDLVLVDVDRAPRLVRGARRCPRSLGRTGRRRRDRSGSGWPARR